MSDLERVRALLSAGAVRERAHEMLALGEAGALEGWSVHLDALPRAADFTLETIRADYPGLDIPFHARWRHFLADGVDRGAPYHAGSREFRDAAERGRAAFDLAIVSVLLDAGAGPAWRYHTRQGSIVARSEGLAIASIDMFEAGLFSSAPDQKRRVDAQALVGLTLGDLEHGFQVDAGKGDSSKGELGNPLHGLAGRLDLLQRLGRAMIARPELFSTQGALRPGALFDRLAAAGTVEAPRILEALLDAFGAIWPSRLIVEGVPLGDSWRHPAIRRADATNGVAPFHKLSQWMAYSLIEPLEWAGVRVVAVDGLTGLPEYRNGGLFVDFGVLTPKDAIALSRPQTVDSLLVVEWRAMTVALLDRLATMLREALGLDAERFPLARALQGGTWSAGRRIARALRPDGGPPLTIVSDGTVF